MASGAGAQAAGGGGGPPGGNGGGSPGGSGGGDDAGSHASAGGSGSDDEYEDVPENPPKKGPSVKPKGGKTPKTRRQPRVGVPAPPSQPSQQELFEKAQLRIRISLDKLDRHVKECQDILGMLQGMPPATSSLVAQLKAALNTLIALREEVITGYHDTVSYTHLTLPTILLV